MSKNIEEKKYSFNSTFQSSVENEFSAYIVQRALTANKTVTTADDITRLTAVVKTEYALKDMLEDLNGSDGFTEDKAALGSIPEAFHLQLHNDFKSNVDFALNKNHFPQGESSISFLCANYNKLVAANVREQSAVFCSLLRYHMVKNGFYATSLEKRSVYVDEYSYYTELKTGEQKFPASKEMVKFVADYWENIVSVVAHVFRVRGHHWKPEYADLYDRTWRCTTITTPERVALPSWEEISRTALHCFGVKALHLVREQAFANGRLSNGLILRRNAACAGTAPIRTSKAVLEVMSRAKWYPHFLKKFQEDIDKIFAQSAQLENIGVKGHINAKLYDWPLRKVDVDLSTVTKLAPYFMGFLSTLDQKDDITKQASLTKRASGGATISRDFANVIIAESRKDSSLQTVETYLST